MLKNALMGREGACFHWGHPNGDYRHAAEPTLMPCTPTHKLLWSAQRPFPTEQSRLSAGCPILCSTESGVLPASAATGQSLAVMAVKGVSSVCVGGGVLPHTVHSNVKYPGERSISIPSFQVGTLAPGRGRRLVRRKRQACRVVLRPLLSNSCAV